MKLVSIWRTREQRYRLVGEICKRCGAKIFPPRDLCPECERVARIPSASQVKQRGMEAMDYYVNQLGVGR